MSTSFGHMSTTCGGICFTCVQVSSACVRIFWHVSHICLHMSCACPRMRNSVLPTYVDICLTSDNTFHHMCVHTYPHIYKICSNRTWASQIPLSSVFLCAINDIQVASGTWCSGITPAQHAGGPGFNPQCVQVVFGHLRRFLRTLRLSAYRVVCK